MHMIGHDNNRRRKHMLHIIRVIVDIPSSKLGEMIGGQVRKFFQELTFQELEFLRKRHFSQLCEFWKSAFLGFPRKTKYFRHITLDNLSSSWEKAKINIKNFTHNDRSNNKCANQKRRNGQNKKHQQHTFLVFWFIKCNDDITNRSGML